jgi:N-acetylneuraminate synthase
MTSTVLVGDRPIGPGSPTYVVAEIGINHNGDVEIAKQLIDMAANSGCDAVKFQKREVDIVYPPEILDAPRESPWGTTQRDQKEGLEFGRAEFDEIDRHCKERGIDWFASAWDTVSLEFVETYDPPHHKVPSALITSEEMVTAIAACGRHTYISTGLSEWEDVDRAVDVFRRHDTPFTLMHCVGTYPMQDEEANLGAMLSLAERYGAPVGFSSHEKGLIGSVTAAALGAVALERHVTLDRAMYGSDQAASLERRGIELLVRDVRELPVIMGDGEKRLTERERPVAEKLRAFVPR